MTNLPGRRRALSRESILLVAPMMTTCPRESSPSISASSVETMLLWIWSCRLLRACTTQAQQAEGSDGVMPQLQSCSTTQSPSWCAHLKDTVATRARRGGDGRCQ